VKNTTFEWRSAERQMYVSSLREPVPPRELIELCPEKEYHCRIPSFVVIMAKTI